MQTQTNPTVVNRLREVTLRRNDGGLATAYVIVGADDPDLDRHLSTSLMLALMKYRGAAGVVLHIRDVPMPKEVGCAN